MAHTEHREVEEEAVKARHIASELDRVAVRVSVNLGLSRRHSQTGSVLDFLLAECRTGSIITVKSAAVKHHVFTLGGNKTLQDKRKLLGHLDLYSIP